MVEENSTKEPRVRKSRYPEISWKKFLSLSRRTEGGKFFCELCNQWVNKVRWIHYKSLHRKFKVIQSSQTNSKT